MTTPDPFEHSDVAYVFGALDAAEVAQFETHLATCDQCAVRVAEARRVTALLADVSEAEIAEAVPETLLPGLLRRAGAERRRQRWITTGLAGIVAACLVTIAIMAFPSSSHHAGRTVALTAVVTSPVRASAELSQTKAGTQIKLHCTYSGRAGREPGAEYWLVVYDKQDNPTRLSNWHLGPGEDQVFEATTALSENQISRISITYASHPILTAKL